MLKFITEIGPLIIFFIGYKIGGIMDATLYTLVALVVAVSITYVVERKIHKMNLISIVLLAISASLTLFSGNTVFIKMKPTILYIVFAGIFLISGIKRKPAVKFLMGQAIKLRSEDRWLQLNFRFMLFFVLMAITNEIVWRSFDEATWVNFKVFGSLPITFIFILLQVPFLTKHQA